MSQSVINQDYRNLDIIVINDGSSDNSLNIIEKIAFTDKHVRFVNKKNEGVSIARNIGIDMSKGEYIAFVDSDDIVSTKYISTLLNCMKKYQADLVICSYTRGIADIVDISLKRKKRKYYH